MMLGTMARSAVYILVLLVLFSAGQTVGRDMYPFFMIALAVVSFMLLKDLLSRTSLIFLVIAGVFWFQTQGGQFSFPSLGHGSVWEMFKGVRGLGGLLGNSPSGGGDRPAPPMTDRMPDFGDPSGMPPDDEPPEDDRDLWSRGRQNLKDHFNRHRGDYPNMRDEYDYAYRARSLLRESPSDAVRIKIRENGDRLVYNRYTNDFAVGNSRGQPETLFKPSQGERYFERQAGTEIFR